MSRYKLNIEYEGTRYTGWQMQKGGKTVQGEILDACREAFGTGTIDVYGAGRTDSGVHATGQVAHLEAVTDLDPLRMKYKINDNLPPDICIKSVEPALPSFHARHDAIARSYIYQISRRRTAFGKKFVWWIKDSLDVEAMISAAALFKGLKDFRSFAAEDGEYTSTKTNIMHASVTVHGDLILFHVIGSHFLWKQVRRMAGVLVETGRGKMKVSDVENLFREKSDVPAKLTAPPSGLFLEKIYYSKEEIEYKASPVLNYI